MNKQKERKNKFFKGYNPQFYFRTEGERNEKCKRCNGLGYMLGSSIYIPGIEYVQDKEMCKKCFGKGFIRG